MDYSKLSMNRLTFKDILCPVSILSSPLNQIWWWVPLSTRLFTKIAIIRYLLNSISKSTIHHFTNVRSSVIRQKGESQNGCFSENLTSFVFLKHPFWDLPFCLVTDEVWHFKKANTGHIKRDIDGFPWERSFANFDIND